MHVDIPPGQRVWRRLGPWAACALCALLWAPRAVGAHPHATPPPINVKVTILDDGYKLSVVLDKQLWRTVAPVPKGGRLWDPKRFETWFASVCVVRADEEVLTFEAASMKGLLTLLDPVTLKPSPPAGIAILRCDRAGPVPKKLTIEWLNFDHILWEDEVQVPVDIRRGMQSDATVLTPEERGLAWHTKEMKKREHGPLAPVAKEAPPVPPTRVPIASLLALAVALFNVFLLRRHTPLIRGGAVLGMLAAAMLLWPVRMDVGGGPGRTKLTVEEAKELFERLHQNIYTAFEVEDEDEIYDRLSVSAKGPVLSKLYEQVYESLVLRDENGAVAHVESVETTARHVTFGDDAQGEFDVVWGWNMIGKVTHWGHSHRRKNVYEAEYTVRRHGDVWHIIEMNVLEYARVSLDPPRKATLPPGER